MSDSAQCEPLVTRRNGTYFHRYYLPWSLSGRVLLWYDIFQLSTPQVAKAVQPCPILGLYSGIFGMYLQHRLGSDSQQCTGKEKNILFHALWVLYFLSAATGILNIVGFSLRDPVSMDEHRCLTLF